MVVFVLNLIFLLIVLLYYYLSSDLRDIFFIISYCIGVILKLFDIIMTNFPYSEGFAILYIISMICALLIIYYSLSVLGENIKKIGNHIVGYQIASFICFIFCVLCSIRLHIASQHQIHLRKTYNDVLLSCLRMFSRLSFVLGIICYQK